MSKRKKKMLICKCCGITGKKGEFRSCPLCKEVLCLYHVKPQKHDCAAVDWEALEEKRDEDISIVTLLKAGALVMALVLLAKLSLGFFSRFWGKLESLWRLAKAEAKVLVGVPALLAATFMIFPGSADVLYAAAAGLESPQQDEGLVRVPEPDVLSELYSCTKAMRYSSLLEDYDGQNCMKLCDERGYSSYGIVKDGASLQCYCCHGSGKEIR